MVRQSVGQTMSEMEGHACRAHRGGMDAPTWRSGRDKHVPPTVGPDKQVPPKYPEFGGARLWCPQKPSQGFSPQILGQILVGDF